MTKPDTEKELVALNAVKDALYLAISGTSEMLLQEYKRSDEFKSHEVENRALGAPEMRILAKNRVHNDFLIAQICLTHEGKIPPRNVFHGKDEIVRQGLSLTGDKELMHRLNAGSSVLCVHGGESGEPAERLSDALSKLKGALGITDTQVEDNDD